MKTHYNCGGEGQDCCHIVIFLGVLNFNHVITTKDFHNVFDIMIGQNSNKSHFKETTFFNLYDLMLKYICAKKKKVTTYRKMQIYF